MNVKDYTNSKDPQVKARREALDELMEITEELFPNYLEMCGECWIKFDSVKCTFKCNVKVKK